MFAIAVMWGPKVSRIIGVFASKESAEKYARTHWGVKTKWFVVELEPAQVALTGKTLHF